MNHSKFVGSWLRHRLVTVELVDMLLEDSLDFKPWDGAMTLSQLVVHIMTSGTWFTEAVKQGVLGKPGDKPAISSLTELKKFTQDTTEQTKAILSSLTDEDMDRLVDATKVFGTKLPRKVLLASMRDHEIHHKGQLFVYARMTGVKNPPMFVKTNL